MTDAGISDSAGTSTFTSKAAAQVVQAHRTKHRLLARDIMKQGSPLKKVTAGVSEDGLAPVKSRTVLMDGRLNTGETQVLQVGALVACGVGGGPGWFTAAAPLLQALRHELNSHVSPSGTTCYITSDMFYIEVQLEKDGNVIDAKLAHLGEAPVICDDLVEHLRTQDVNRVTEVLHGKVGHLVYCGSQVCGAKIDVTVEGTDMLHKLPLSPLLDSQPGEDGHNLKANKSYMLSGIQITGLKLAPLYELIVQSTLKEKGSEDLFTHKSRFFVVIVPFWYPKVDNGILHFQFYHKITVNTDRWQIFLTFSSSSTESSGDILAKHASLKKAAVLEEGPTDDALKSKTILFVQQSNSITMAFSYSPKHCYFINTGSAKSDLAGALVSKIPFTHPKCVPDVIEILRHQMAYNSLISSCVSEKHTNEVIIDVVTSREVQCSLHLNPRDPTLNSSDGFISRAVKRCMSVPVVMRAIFRNAAKVEADSKMQVDTKQKPEPACEQITDLNSLEESPSVAGHQDLVVTDKQSVPDSPKENLSTAKSEALGDNMEKSNPTVSMETLCRVEESTSTAITEAVMKDM
uniref:Mediator of RNA polymerase II transcription subunit 1 n=1 Tax=Anas platyrhynchos TaxID=8839 RepID=A0A8B9TPM2_ANAPL